VPTLTPRNPPSVLDECPGYFPVSGAYLYTVLHQVEDPIARVLLVGPFAAERHTSYRTWVQWARHLATKGFEVLRYDYRGVGESTGSFEEMTFESWTDDIHCLAAWLRKRERNAPLILHGLQLGGLLAARAFHDGEADALLLWSTPTDANKVLRSALQHWIGPLQLLKREGERKLPSHYFRLLEEGKSVEVEGYEWSAELWRQSLSFGLPAPMTPPNDPAKSYDRPVRMVALGKNAAPLVYGAVPGYDENKDFSWLFHPNSDWMASNLSVPLEASRA
jgi:pimeloyl-ACP methyl ester carboxylesterase